MRESRATRLSSFHSSPFSFIHILSIRIHPFRLFLFFSFVRTTFGFLEYFIVFFIISSYRNQPAITSSEWKWDYQISVSRILLSSTNVQRFPGDPKDTERNAWIVIEYQQSEAAVLVISRPRRQCDHRWSSSAVTEHAEGIHGNRQYNENSFVSEPRMMMME